MPAPLTAIVPLRQARKGFTRGHICAASRELFFQDGYAAVTMEQIAQAAGIQRSTLYTHFREKEAILGAIVDDYVVGLREVVAALPGPLPTRDEVARWVELFARFAARERAPTELLVTASNVTRLPAPIQAFGETFLQMLAERSPAFAAALEPATGLSHAWAMATLRELGWALCYYAQHGDGAGSTSRLTVATTMFSRFIHNEV